MGDPVDAPPPRYRRENDRNVGAGLRSRTCRFRLSEPLFMGICLSGEIDIGETLE